jgi:hypothetical protein
LKKPRHAESMRASDLPSSPRERSCATMRRARGARISGSGVSPASSNKVRTSRA